MFNFHDGSAEIIEEAKCKAYDGAKHHSHAHHSQDQVWSALTLDLHISQGPGGDRWNIQTGSFGEHWTQGMFTKVWELCR